MKILNTKFSCFNYNHASAFALNFFRRFIEEMMTEWAKNTLNHFGLDTLVLSGGLALNIKANKLISELNNVHKFFVPSAGGDSSAVADRL